MTLPTRSRDTIREQAAKERTGGFTRRSPLLKGVGESHRDIAARRNARLIELGKCSLMPDPELPHDAVGHPCLELRHPQPRDLRKVTHDRGSIGASCRKRLIVKRLVRGTTFRNPACPQRLLCRAYLEDQGRDAAAGASNMDGLVGLVRDGERHHEMSIPLGQCPLPRDPHRQQDRLGGAGGLSNSGCSDYRLRGRGRVCRRSVSERSTTGRKPK